MGRVGRRDGLLVGPGRRHLADVGVLARDRRPGRRVGPRLARLEHTVAVVTGLVHRHDTLIVGHRDAGEVDVPGVGDHVGPGHRVAHGDRGPGRRVGIHAVGRLLDADRRRSHDVERDAQRNEAVDRRRGADEGRVERRQGRGRLGEVEEAVHFGDDEVEVLRDVGAQGRGVQHTAIVGELDRVLLLVLELSALDDVIVVRRQRDRVVPGGDRSRERAGLPHPGKIAELAGDAVGDAEVDDDVAGLRTVQRPQVVRCVRIGDLGVTEQGGDGGIVAVLTLVPGIPERDAGRLVGPGFAGIEHTVAVVTRHVHGSRVQRWDRRLVDDDHVGERDVAGVRHHVGPRHRIHDPDARTGSDVGVDAVGGLLDVDRGCRDHGDLPLARAVGGRVGHRGDPGDGDDEQQCERGRSDTSSSPDRSVCDAGEHPCLPSHLSVRYPCGRQSRTGIRGDPAAVPSYLGDAARHPLGVRLATFRSKVIVSPRSGGGQSPWGDSTRARTG